MISNMYSYFFVHTLHCMGFSVSSRKGGGAQTYWHQAYSSSLWHCLGHSQGFLQCHFSRCKVGSFKGLRVRIVLVDAFTDLMRCRK